MPVKHDCENNLFVMFREYVPPKKDLKFSPSFAARKLIFDEKIFTDKYRIGIKAKKGLQNAIPFKEPK